MLIAHCSMLIAQCSLLIAHCSLLIAHCSLLIAHCSPMNVAGFMSEEIIRKSAVTRRVAARFMLLNVCLVEAPANISHLKTNWLHEKFLNQKLTQPLPPLPCLTRRLPLR